MLRPESPPPPLPRPPSQADVEGAELLSCRMLRRLQGLGGLGRKVWICSGGGEGCRAQGLSRCSSFEDTRLDRCEQRMTCKP